MDRTCAMTKEKMWFRKVKDRTRYRVVTKRDRCRASRLLTPDGSWTEANDDPDDPGERVERNA